MTDLTLPRRPVKVHKPSMFGIVYCAFLAGLFATAIVSAVKAANWQSVAPAAAVMLAFGTGAVLEARNAARYHRLARPAITLAHPIFTDLHDPEVTHVDVRVTRRGDEWHATRTAVRTQAS